MTVAVGPIRLGAFGCLRSPGIPITWAITGATAGIGRAVALRLAAVGASVIVHGRDEQRGAETVKEIAAAGGKARFVAADLSSSEDVLRLAAEAGEVDVLINNAGIYRFAGTPATTAGMFDAQMVVNSRAPMLLVGALAPGMAARGCGVIVNVSPAAATTPVRDSGAN
ncbi:hypothetical protein GCM10010260_60860 [Streptomyces filipinensis]|uniref:SDR family NAD(P)-dependent oxidoreductase n=1 Tax=Streptomyces filipinensis TaxID=66887 RepID=A0A918ME85_9ACTN|nr:SDR family NAD(P)-dependent oxidoreductase [Streptomyces filipinensis]GGV13739.1 hypothetical protein GCM10010260_60860 [Streptomyces filipinensis]